MRDPEPGLEILPGVTLRRRLGRGGMGEAWLARDAAGQDLVAKLVRNDAPPEAIALLRREARLVRKLRHPAIVPVLGFHQGERFSAITLRHMPGGDASTLRGRPPLDVVRAARSVADALAYLHDLGVVHRDVKASNVLLDAAGRAHLADFGIASLSRPDEGEDGLVVAGGGSRASMSPQQRAGRPAAPSDDLYALGVLLFELLTGEPPANADASVSAPVLWTRPMPERLRGLVASLLAHAPEARPRSAAAARDELDAVALELERQPGDAPAAASEVTGRQHAPPSARDLAGPAGVRPLKLQPPPRLAPAAATHGEAELFAGARRQPPVVRFQVAVIGVLVALAIAAVVWLPRFAEQPDPSPPEAPAAVPTSAPAAADARNAPSPGGSATAPRPEAEPTSPVTSPGEATPSAEAEPALRRHVEPSSPPRAAASGSPRARAAASAEPTAPSGEAALAVAPEPDPTPDPVVEAKALAGHRERGLAFEQKEEWRAALGEYDAALAIDAHVTFAIEGRERALRRALLYEAIDGHLQRRERLSAAAVGREAEELIERARRLDAPGTSLEARVAALERALAEARQPIPVVIESDGLTELTVTRVGRLGTLKRRTLELLPGSYTVTGSRPGYRDVRRQFSVGPGAPAPVVALRCEDAL